MRKLPVTATKICLGCQRELPVTEEYFRRFKGSRDGFQARCKDCSQAWIKEHYIHFSEKDVETRGIVGVKCPLYSPKCVLCNVLRDCWRLADIEPGSVGMPLKVLKKSRFTLQKGE